MFRAPLYFTVSYIAGLFHLIGQASTEMIAIYTIVSGGVLAGFGAVWVKMWQIHSDWKEDKNTTIKALRAETESLRETVSMQASTIAVLKSQLSEATAKVEQLEKLLHAEGGHV